MGGGRRQQAVHPAGCRRFHHVAERRTHRAVRGDARMSTVRGENDSGKTDVADENSRWLKR